MQLDRGDVVLTLVGAMLLYRAIRPLMRRLSRRRFEQETEGRDQAWRSIRSEEETPDRPDEPPRD